MIFNPPIPENIAFSFYIQGTKLSFAVYHTSIQGKSSGYFKHAVCIKEATNQIFKFSFFVYNFLFRLKQMFHHLLIY